MAVKGIDVSQFNGTVDFEKVKAAGYSFVMVRGFSTNKSGFYIDTSLHRNIKAAQAAGMDVGVYGYSYALTPAKAVTEVQSLLIEIAPYKLTMPVAFDIEDKTQLNLGKATLTAICKAALNTIQAAGYYATLYSYLSFFNLLDLPQLETYDKWVAHVNVSKCGYTGNYGMWQHSWTGVVPGCTGDVDLNLAYKDYPTIIKAAGLNGYAATVSGYDMVPRQLLEETQVQLTNAQAMLKGVVTDITAVIGRYTSN